MKIAVATGTGGLDDTVSPNFGRAPTITFVEVDDATGEIVGHEVVENPFAAAASGAGTRTSQLVVEKGASLVLAGAFGPKAAQVLEATGIRAIPVAGPVREAVHAALSGEPPASAGPGAEVPGAPGVPPGGGWPPAGAGPGMGPGGGFGGGMGRGMGPGGGFGGGMGRGRGRGMGRGRGRGGGRGRCGW